MDSYYQQLIERERRHIREMVGITAYEGHTVTFIKNGQRTAEQVTESAEEARDREIAADQELKEQLKCSVLVDYEGTGRARDLSFLEQHCRDIYTQPRSYRVLESALYSISETVAELSYPDEDRRRVIAIFNDLQANAHLDNCMHNELFRTIQRLTCVRPNRGSVVTVTPLSATAQ